MSNEAKEQLIGPFKVLKWPDRLGMPGHARHYLTLEDVFIKTEWFSSLAHEAHTLHAASGGVGVPHLHWFETVDGRDVMVTDSYGPTLEEVFCRSGRYFSMQTLLLFADQLLARIEFIHARNIIHGSLNPWSFALGTPGWQSEQVILVDFSTELGLEVTVRDDLQAVGRILSYFYNGSVSWDQYQQVSQQEHQRHTAPIFATFMRAVSSRGSIDYGALRNIFRHAYEDFAVHLAVALDLRGTRALRDGFIPNMGILSTMKTEVLFDNLSSKLTQIGHSVSHPKAALSHQISANLLESLEEMLQIYIVLLVRERPSHDTKQVIRACHLPNRLWRDLRWFLDSTKNSSDAFRLAFVSKIYKFVATLYDAVPSYRLYWEEYLFVLARARRDAEPNCGKSAWTQTIFYWKGSIMKKVP